MKAITLVILLSVALSVLCAAQDEAGPRIEQWVEDLGAPKFADRERAEAALIAAGVTALPVLVRRLDDPDPEIRIRAQAVMQAIMPEFTPVAVGALKRLIDGVEGDARLECVSVLFSLPDTKFERLFPALVSERENVLPGVLATLTKGTPTVRARALRYVRSFDDVELPDDVKRILLVLAGKWSELFAMGEVAYPEITAALKGEITVEQRKLRDLVSLIRFRHRQNGGGFGPALVAALPNAGKELCGEIARALVVLGHEPEKATPFLLKSNPLRVDLPIRYGITNSIEEALEFAAGNKPKREQDIRTWVRWQLTAIGALGRRGEKYLDRWSEIAEKAGREIDVCSACEDLANIGPAAVPMAIDKAKKQQSAFIRTIRLLGDEATFGDPARDAQLTGDLLPRLLAEGVYAVLPRPNLAASLTAIEQARADMPENLAAKYGDLLAVVHAQAGKGSTALLARLVGAQDSGRVWSLMRAVADLGLGKEAAERCAYELRIEREQGIEDFQKRGMRVRNLIGSIHLLKHDAEIVMPELLKWKKLSEDAPGEQGRSHIKAVRLGVWGQIEYLAPYSRTAIAEIMAKVAEDPGWVSSLAYVIAYGHPYGEDADLGPLARAFAGAFKVRKRGNEICVWHAQFGARGLVMLGERAVSVVAELERVIQEGKPPVTSLARAALVRVTGGTEPHVKEIGKRLTPEGIATDLKYRSGLPVKYGHSAYAAELLGTLGKELAPALKELCFDPSLRWSRRREVLRAFYVVDGGGEESASIVGDILDCPLIFEDWVTREFQLKMLSDLGVSSPALRAKVESMVLQATDYRERAIARAIVKNGFKPIPPDPDDVER